MYRILKIKHTTYNIKNNSGVKNFIFEGEQNEEVYKNNFYIISNRIIVK